MHQLSRRGWKYFAVVRVLCIYIQYRCEASYKKGGGKEDFCLCHLSAVCVVCVCCQVPAEVPPPEIHVLL